MKTIVVSGVSGSGKSLAYKTFEDLGFYCMDNVPVDMLPHYQSYFETHQNLYDRVVLVIDARDAKSIKKLPLEISQWKQKDQSIDILFLDARDQVLIQRYSETRHRHPLSKQGSIEDGIAKERELLSPVKDIATHHVDTSEFSSRDLRQYLLKRFGQTMVGTSSLGVTVMSFGFKYGVPLNSDLLFDVRFLTNPFFEKELKAKTGLDPSVQKFVMDQEDAKAFVSKLQDMMAYLIPLYEKEGKSYLQLSIGCTGGQHRSVTIAEIMGAWFASQNLDVSIIHREQRG